MKDNILQVSLWGQTVGRLWWEDSRGRAVFQFDENFKHSGLDISPLTASLNSPIVQRGFPIYGNREKLYSGLPEFIADSLPDRWGNTVFQQWLEKSHISVKQVNAVDRLSFIGKRAMGALEYFPAQIVEDASVDINLASLYQLANDIFRDRQDISIDIRNSIIMEDLYKVGTSAGGQRPKAIIAIDEGAGIVRSGQAELPPNFIYYILKFDIGRSREFPFTLVEMAYYLMALDAGIDMMPSRLVGIDGRQHFLTQRFDRVGGKKVHTQTLAALSSLADAYEDLFVVGRKLGLTADEQEQQYRRMVFNVLAGNVDDHTKNFSFLMYPDGKWKVSPAYDLLFSIDLQSRLFRNHELSVMGKRYGITVRDLLAFAQKQNIKNAPVIIKQVAEVVGNFRTYAAKTGVSDYWADKIDAALKEELIR